jgi:predicted DNA-binding protein
MTGKRGRPPSGGDKIVSFAEFTAPLKYKWALEDLAGKTPKKKHLFFREALKNYIDDNNYEAILAQEQALADMHARNAQELSRKIGERDAEKNIAAEGKIRKLIMGKLNRKQLAPDSRAEIVDIVCRLYSMSEAVVSPMYDSIRAEFATKYGDDINRIFEED